MSTLAENSPEYAAALARIRRDLMHLTNNAGPLDNLLAAAVALQDEAERVAAKPAFNVVDSDECGRVVVPGLTLDGARRMAATLNDEWESDLKADYGPFFPGWRDPGGAARFDVQRADGGEA